MTVRSLFIALGVSSLCVTAFCVGLAIAARRFEPSTVWVTSTALVAGVGLIALARLYLQPLVIQQLSLTYAVFFLTALLGLPSATAVWVAIRRAARPIRGSILVDSILVTASFMLVLLAAAMVAAIPDMFALFG